MNLSCANFGIYNRHCLFGSYTPQPSQVCGQLIFISGNLAGFQFFFSKCPFFQKIIENPIIKPHTNRRMSRPAIRIMVADSGILTGICFFVWISLQLKEIDHAGIKFVLPSQGCIDEGIFKILLASWKLNELYTIFSFIENVANTDAKIHSFLWGAFPMVKFTFLSSNNKYTHF